MKWTTLRTRLTPEWRPNSDLADRLGLLVISYGAFKFSNWPWLSDRVPGRPALVANLAIQYVAFAAFCVLLALACRRPLPVLIRRLRLHRLLWLSPLFAVLVVLVVGAGIARPITHNRLLVDDANAMAVCGARAIANGQDPYRVAEIPCLSSLGLSPLLATPYRVGPLASVRTYPTPDQILAAANSPDHGGQRLFSPLGKPPLDPAFMVPVARASSAARAVWTLLPILLLLLVVIAVAGPLWPAAGGLFLLTYFLNGSAVNFAANGNAEAFSYVFLALGVLFIRRPWLSAVCLGLAIGGNELAWFFLPGYVLLAADFGGWWRRGAGVLLTLAVAVVPWVVRYPDSVRAVYDSLTAHTFALGSGPSVLVLAGLWSGPARIVWLLATGVAIALIWLWGAGFPRWRISAAVLLLAPSGSAGAASTSIWPRYRCWLWSHCSSSSKASAV
ncbi:MAG: hypothetical protein ACYDC5_05610 [Candidatus Dormibacteria bacterium]